MAAPQYKIIIEKGITKTMTLTRKAQGAPVNITGATATLKVYRNLVAAPLFTLAGTVDGPNGKITFVIPDSANLVLGDELKFTIDVVIGSETDRYLKGTILVEL